LRSRQANVHNASDSRAEQARAGYRLVLAGHLHGGQCVLATIKDRLYPAVWVYPWHGLRFATGDARISVGLILNEIRGAKTIQVGQGSLTSFTQVTNGALQQGNALQIYPTTNTANFIVYFLNASDQTFRRTGGASGPTMILARSVTNTVVFSAQDCLGNVLTNNQNNRVIQMELDFYQWEFPVAQVRQGAYYDHYRLQTRITRRTIE